MSELAERFEATPTFVDELLAWYSNVVKALEAIQRVRELHGPSDEQVYCDGELTFVCCYCEHAKYPCQTLRVLDGEQ